MFINRGYSSSPQEGCLHCMYFIFDSYFRGKVHKISPMADLNKRAQHRKSRSSDTAKLPEKKRNTSQ